MIDYHFQMIGNRVQVVQRGYETKILSIASLESMVNGLAQRDPKRAVVLSYALDYGYQHVGRSIEKLMDRFDTRSKRIRPFVRALWAFVSSLVLLGGVQFWVGNTILGVLIMIGAASIILFIKWRTA